MDKKQKVTKDKDPKRQERDKKSHKTYEEVKGKKY